MTQAALTNPADGAAPASPPATAWTITSRQRDPQIFAGLRGDDVEDWLDNYNRVSSFNRWDDKLKLLNVVFYLTDVAKTWFLNHEEDLADWAQFTAQLRQIFGTSTSRLEAAKKKLDERVQHPAESYTSYIEDVLALCRRVNRDMSECDRVKHILKEFPLLPSTHSPCKTPALYAMSSRLANASMSSRPCGCSHRLATQLLPTKVTCAQ